LRLKRAATIVGALQDAGARPDLGLRHAAAIVEDADDLPLRVAPAQLPADFESCELQRRAASDDDFERAGPESPAFRDSKMLAQFGCTRTYAAQWNVGGSSNTAHGDIDDDIEFGRTDRAVGIALHASRILDDFGLRLADVATHFIRRTAAHDDGYVVGARLIEHCSKALAHRQNADEDQHDSRYADRCNDRRREALRNIADAHPRNGEDLGDPVAHDALRLSITLYAGHRRS
jgi:hypothetical protein